MLSSPAWFQAGLEMPQQEGAVLHSLLSGITPPPTSTSCPGLRVYCTTPATGAEMVNTALLPSTSARACSASTNAPFSTHQLTSVTRSSLTFSRGIITDVRLDMLDKLHNGFNNVRRTGQERRLHRS